MDFSSQDKVALFIDGSNLYSTARALGFDIDYKKLLNYFTGPARLLRGFYYTALVEDQDFAPIRPLVDWLDYNGFTMITKVAKEYTDQYGRRKVKGNMEIELAVDMLDIAPHIDHAILFSGNGDYSGLIEAVKRKGVRCSVVSTVQTSPSLISDELRRQADEFVELVDVAPHIARNPSELDFNNLEKEKIEVKIIETDPETTDK